MSGLLLHIIILFVNVTGLLSYPVTGDEDNQYVNRRIVTLSEQCQLLGLDICEWDDTEEEENEKFFTCYLSSNCRLYFFPRKAIGLGKVYTVQFILFEADTSPPVLRLV